MDQLGDHPGPAGLVTGAEPFARVAVEILVELDEVAPVWVGIETFAVAVHRAPTLRVARKEADEPSREFHRHLPQRHLLARTRRAFDLEVLAQIVVVLLQRFDQQEVQRKPHRTAPVGIAAEQRAGRLGGRVVERKRLAVQVERERMVGVELGHRSHAMRTQHGGGVEHRHQDARELVGVDDRQAHPVLHARRRIMSDSPSSNSGRYLANQA